MATRSNIGIVNEDKSITAIYVHWDGYPEHVGKVLLNHYNTADIVNNLMKLGDLSQLCENLFPTETHSFETPQKGVCVAYGRDRGEKGVESQLFKTLSSFEKNMDNSGAEYQYVFDTTVGKWMFRGYKIDWKDLTQADFKM